MTGERTAQPAGLDTAFDAQGTGAIQSRADLDATKLLVDVYKHHFDLYLKGVVIQLAVVGAVSGLVFRPETDQSTKLALLAFASIVSTIGAVGWMAGMAWHRRITRAIDEASGRAGFADTITFMAKRATALGAVATVVLAVGCVWLLIRSW